MKLLLLISLIFACTAFAQQPFVNGSLGSDGGSLCMAIGGSPTPGMPVTADDCVTGAPLQQFAVGANGYLHVGSPTGTYCVAGKTNGNYNYAGEPVILYACASLPANQGAYRLWTDFLAGSQPRLCYVDSSTNSYCITLANNSPGQPLTMNLYQNAASPIWTSTIANRLVSKNLNPNGLFNAQGCLSDRMGTSLTQFCGLIAVQLPSAAAPLGSAYAAGSTQAIIANRALTITGNGGKIVSSGAGNIVSSGAGNIVASGAGNIVASGAGNLQYVDRTGKPVLDAVIGPSGNIVASGAGNIVASGAGNIVSTGGSNFQLQSSNGVFAYGSGDSSVLTATSSAITQALRASTPTPYAVAAASADPGPWAAGSTHTIAWQSAQGVAAPASGEVLTIYLANATQNVVLCANVPAGQARCSAVAPSGAAMSGNINILDQKTGKNFVITAVTQIAAAAPNYKVSSVSADASPWLPGSTHTIVWSASGVAAAGDTVNVYLQPNSGAAILLCSKIPAAAGRCAAYAPSAPITGFLDVRDAASGNNAYASFQTQVAAPVQAPAPFALAGSIAIDSKVVNTATVLSWTAASPHLIQWTATGTASAQETVSLWLAQGSGQVRLASGIPAGQLSYNLAGNSVRAGTTGQFLLKDDLTNRQVNGPTISVH